MNSLEQTSTANCTVASDIDHVVILAGGKGTRLTTMAPDLPKVLVPVGGTPVLQHQLELARDNGMRNVTVLAGHLGGEVQAFVGDGSRFGLAARVEIEDQPLGNAGLLARLLDRLPEHFIVLYGDLMLSVDFSEILEQHLRQAADFTAVVHPNDHPLDSDLFETDAEDWVTAIHAYPHPDDASFENLVNAALYVVRREALRPWADSRGKLDFTKDILPGLIANGSRVLAHRSTAYIKDMGTPARLARVEADWRAGKLAWPARQSDPAIFLDRDGTLIVEHGRLRDPRDLQLIPGVATALKSLRDAGFRLVVLTNQPIIARGEATEDDVAAVHRRLEWELGKQGVFLDRIYVCPHHPDAGFPGERAELKIHCECRKPGTAMFERASRELRLDPTRSWMIGDQTRDIEMARRAGLQSILVQTGHAGGDRRFAVEPSLIAADISAAAALILERVEAA